MSNLPLISRIYRFFYCTHLLRQPGTGMESVDATQRYNRHVLREVLPHYASVHLALALGFAAGVSLMSKLAMPAWVELPAVLLTVVEALYGLVLATIYAVLDAKHRKGEF